MEITWNVFTIKVLCKYQMNSECYVYGLEILKVGLCFIIWLHTYYMKASIFLRYNIIKREKENILVIKCCGGESEKIENIFSDCKYPGKKRIWGA